MLAGKGAAPAYQTALAGIERGDGAWTRARCASTCTERTRDQVFNAGTMPVFSRKWGDGQERFDEIVTELPDRQRPLPDRQGRHAAAHRVQAQPRLLGARPAGAARALQLRPRRLPHTTRTRRSRARPSRPASSTSSRSTRARAWVRQHKGVKWGDGRIVKHDLHDRHRPAACRPTTSTCAGRCSRTSACARRWCYTYDFETSTTATAVHSAPTACSTTPSSPPRACPRRASWRCWSPSAPSCRRGCSARPSWRRAPTADPNALRAQPAARRARCSTQAGWKLGDDGKLRNAKGEAFEFEYLAPQRRPRRTTGSATSKKLGITLQGARWSTSRSTAAGCEQYDFDMVVIVERRVHAARRRRPGRRIYGSKAADEQGNSNFRGVKSRAVDALIEADGPRRARWRSCATPAARSTAW